MDEVKGERGHHSRSEKEKTGVEIRFHKWAEWDKLSGEYKAELISHRELTVTILEPGQANLVILLNSPTPTGTPMASK